jgi:hypothetical protein
MSTGTSLRSAFVILPALSVRVDIGKLDPALVNDVHGTCSQSA